MAPKHTFEIITALISVLTLSLSSYALYRTYQEDTEHLVFTQARIDYEDSSIKLHETQTEGFHGLIGYKGTYLGSDGPEQSITHIPVRLTVSNLSSRSISIVQVQMHLRSTNRDHDGTVKALDLSSTTPVVPLNVPGNSSSGLTIYVEDWLDVPVPVAEACSRVHGSLKLINLCLLVEQEKTKNSTPGVAKKNLESWPDKLMFITSSGRRYEVDLPPQ